MYSRSKSKSIPAIFAGFLAIFVLFSAIHLSSSPASADNTGNMSASVSVAAACSLSVAGTNHSASVIPGNSVLIGASTVTAICNDPSGLAVYTVGYTGNAYGNNDLTATINQTDYSIPSGATSPATTSQWNVTIAPVTGTYAPTVVSEFLNTAHIIPTQYTKVAYRNTITDLGTGASGAQFTADFNAYVDMTQVAGTYTGKVKFLLIHPNVLTYDDQTGEPATTQPENIIGTMQDVVRWEHQVTSGQTVTAIDERDNELYTVARLADGKLWMTRNLRLNLETANITATNTNNPSQAFLTAVTGQNRPMSSSSWCSEQSSACMDQILYNAQNLGDTTINSADGTAYDEYGVYYNWYTATAGNGTYQMDQDDAIGDICPSGWHLPEGTVDTTSNSDFGRLTIALGGPKNSSDIASNMTTSSNPTSNQISNLLWFTPNSFTRSGLYFGTNRAGTGTTSSLWTSTSNPVHANFARVVFISETNITPNQDNNDKRTGLAVRCIANQKTMQTVANWSDAVQTGQTVTAIDERDGTDYTVARLVDGKLWMTQDLRLDPSMVTFTASNTNSPYVDASNSANSFATLAASSAPTEEGCNEYSVACVDQVDFKSGTYNWFTATAGNGKLAMRNDGANTQGDICSYGWHLPSGGRKDNIDADLSDAYRIIRAIIGEDPNSSVGGDSTQPYYDGGQYSIAVQASPGNFSQYIYWTKTINGSRYYAYTFIVGSTGVAPVNFNGKYNRNRIRCLSEY